MIRTLPLLFALITLPLFLQAQRIIGSLQDSSKQPLIGATVMLIQEKDSALASFVLTNDKGEFRLSPLKQQTYLLKVSFLGYQQEEQKVTLREGQKEVLLDPITLFPQDLTLDKVSIEADKSPILMKDDTVEYNADVFGAQPGEVVEDLLKKLPGVDVDENGDIKAQGQRVNKVTVDGKEFFGNDPKLATKNLPADAIKKVQVFDEKSDEEDISGVDDGTVNQTINLELKEDRKTGYFGNVEAGYGTNERYQFKGNINRFSPKTQVSAIGLANNINEDGFSFNEYIQFMGGLSSFMEGGSVNIQIDENSGIPLSGLNQNGIFTTEAGGLNGNIDLSKKLRLTTNYLFSGVGTRKEQEVNREQFLTDEFFLSEIENRQSNQYYNHRLNSKLRFRGDSIARFNLGLNLGLRNANNFDTTRTDVFGAETNLENTANRTNENSRRVLDGEITMSYLTRLKKKGRSLSLSSNVSRELDEQSGLFQSMNTLFPGGIVFTTNITQDQDQFENELAYGANIKYTEPLGKNGNSLSFLYNLSNTSEEQDRDVFDRFPRRERNIALSNQFQRDYRFQRGGLILALNGEKTNFQIGANFQNSLLQGDLISLGDSVRQTFNTVLPSMRFNYKWKTGLRGGLRYRTTFREPSLTQLQPFIDNRDPFNLYIGNPALRPEYIHALTGDFLLYDSFSFTSLFAFLTAEYSQNPIVEARDVDSLFRQIRRPINVDNAIRIRGSINFDTPIKRLKMKVGIRLEPNFNRGITFINGNENMVNRWTNSVGLRLENRKKKSFDAAIGAKLTFNDVRYSLSSELDRSFLNQVYYADLRVNFLKNWIFRTNFDWAIYAGGNFAEDVQVPLLKASLTRQLFKKKVRLEIEAFDILNQNKGITRRAELNYIEDGNSLTLRRFFSFKLSYSLGSNPNKGSGAFIIDKR
ncbi:MAG: TonB-dependent receptor family protein [Bacteroidia bacterium]|nr:TonB-dependent receptor family protein [Bacteroidia bacterium]